MSEDHMNSVISLSGLTAIVAYLSKNKGNGSGRRKDNVKCFM
jgi:hypothetical protein